MHVLCVPKKWAPYILQQQPQICSDLNIILHAQDDICYKHYYVVSYKSALTLLKYEFLNNITHKSWVSIAVDVSHSEQSKWARQEQQETSFVSEIQPLIF